MPCSSGSSPASNPMKGTKSLVIDVLVQSPSATRVDMQVICLFRRSAGGGFGGSLALIDQALTGLLLLLHSPERFEGLSGETLLFTPPPGTLPASRLILIGLGDAETFTPERMRLIGKILFREADRLGISHPYFAPTVLDGGMERFTTGDVSEQVVLGVLDAQGTTEWLAGQNAAERPVVRAITLIAGETHRASTEQGVQRALLLYDRRD